MKINKIYRNKIYLDTEEIMDISPLIRQKYDLKVNDDIEKIYDENFETSQKGLFVAGDIAVKNGGSIAIALNHAFKILTFINTTKEYK